MSGTIENRKKNSNDHEMKKKKSRAVFVRDISKHKPW